MKVKAKVLVLIEQVAESKARVEREHAEKVAAFPALEAAYRERLAEQLAREAHRIAGGGKLPDVSNGWSGNRYRESVSIETALKKPRKPPARPDTAKHRMRLKELRLEARDEILIDPRAADWLGLL